MKTNNNKFNEDYKISRNKKMKELLSILIILIRL